MSGVAVERVLYVAQTHCTRSSTLGTVAIGCYYAAGDGRACSWLHH
jgi:hypothetical protein